MKDKVFYALVNPRIPLSDRQENICSYDMRTRVWNTVLMDYHPEISVQYNSSCYIHFARPKLRIDPIASPMVVVTDNAAPANSACSIHTLLKGKSNVYCK